MDNWTKPSFPIRALAIGVLASTINMGAVLMLFAGSSPTRAATPTAVRTCPQLTHLQQRLIEKASIGSAALRDYIFITRGIFGLNYVETVEWLDSTRARFQACGML